jgi:hypothetical protein
MIKCWLQGRGLISGTRNFGKLLEKLAPVTTKVEKELSFIAR